jgi:hypothetical protein
MGAAQTRFLLSFESCNTALIPLGHTVQVNTHLRQTNIQVGEQARLVNGARVPH